jgi:hypothetical protein
MPLYESTRRQRCAVLAATYEECGNRGRFRARAGDVLLHRAFDAHLDHIGPKGV